jgi:P27 family predicted phage terminase small subunit
MGKRGPQKEPLALKLAKGTARRSDRESAVAPSELPEKPSWLATVGDVAADTWDETIESLSKIPGMLAKADGPALAAYCVAWQRFRQAQDEINRDGITCYSEKGAQYQHPAVGIQHKSIEIITRIGAKFGMTPSDRSSMRVTQPKAEGVRRRQA